MKNNLDQIKAHLEYLELDPKIIPCANNRLSFNLALGIRSELLIIKSKQHKDKYQIRLITEMDCNSSSHSDIHVLITLIAPLICPCIITYHQKILSLNILLLCPAFHMKDFINKGIVLMRFMVSIIFTSINKLIHNEKSLEQALYFVIKQLEIK